MAHWHIAIVAATLVAAVHRADLLPKPWLPTHIAPRTLRLLLQAPAGSSHQQLTASGGGSRDGIGGGRKQGQGPHFRL